MGPGYQQESMIPQEILVPQKQDRWYVADGDALHVFNAADPRRATGCSTTSIADLTYYRQQFRLRKVPAEFLAPAGPGAAQV